MEIIELQNLDDERIKVFSSLTDHQLKGEGKEFGLFIAESPKVIRVAFEEGFQGVSLLCEPRHIKGDAADIIANHPELTVFTGSREILSSLTGYKLTRGVLCAMKRPPLPSATEICKSYKKVAVVESVCDTTNIGSIFRSAVALGIDAILLTPDSCDPFNRRAIRVSMGAVFKIPWTFHPDPVSLLNDYGFTTIALALHEDAVPLSSPELKNKERIAMVLGTEGDGITHKIISKCRYKAIIPMHHNVDSLNVGAAAAIAFWELLKP